MSHAFRCTVVLALYAGTGLAMAPQPPTTPPAAQAATTTPSQGETVYRTLCAACHVAAAPFLAPPPPGAPPAAPLPPPPVSLDPKAPNREALRQYTPEAVLAALTTGKMQIQGSALPEADKRAVAEYASGKTFLASLPDAMQNHCKAPPKLSPALAGNNWNGWGNGPTNTRFQPAARGKLTAADLPRLELKWAFGYSTVSAARAQPALAGGRLFVASENGDVHALDPKSGCTIWTFRAQVGIRSALSIGPYKDGAGKARNGVYFADQKANAYGIDAETGRQIWTRRVDEHPVAGSTGAVAVSGGRVFVPVQGVAEESTGGTRKGYECCTFRGSLSALDASTGAVLWKTYTVGESKPRGTNKDGTQLFGPAGGSIWSSPTVDEQRGVVYAATGNGFADPPQPMTNAVLALDVRTGAVRWSKQLLKDTWAMGCPEDNRDGRNPACPKELGPDFDFSAAPALTRVKGRDLLVIPQKSGLAYALDPAKSGEVVWEYRYAQGSAMGGQWGGATDGERAYFGVADLLTATPGGMRAVNLADGSAAWSMPPQKRLCGEGPNCRAGQGGALVAIPGAVLSAGTDGGIRAYSSKDGTILWLFDTGREFDTVNGVKAKGGGMDGSAMIVADGILYVNSGYGGLVGAAGNVLLAFGVAK